MLQLHHPSDVRDVTPAAAPTSAYIENLLQPSLNTRWSKVRCNLPRIDGNELRVLPPATAAAVPKGPAVVVVPNTAHNAQNTRVEHLLITLFASAQQSVRPLAASLAAAALKIAMSTIPSNRTVALRIARLNV
jgi:hypothetical protein